MIKRVHEKHAERKYEIKRSKNRFINQKRKAK